MPWGAYPLHPGRATMLGGGLLHHKSRIVIRRNVVTINEPMVGPLIVLPSLGAPVTHARDLHQRIFCTSNDRVLRRTVKMNGALQSAAADVAGYPPEDSATWSEVSATVIGQHSGHEVVQVFQDPSWLSLIDYVDLWTWVWQPFRQFTQGFRVVHELWANRFYWTDSNDDHTSLVQAGYTNEKTQFSLRLDGRVEG